MQADGDEWKEYVENKLDYSNLKIDKLKLEEEGEQDEEGAELNEDGEKTKKSKEGGPWSKLVASDSVDDSKEDDDEVAGEFSLVCFLSGLQLAQSFPFLLCLTIYLLTLARVDTRYLSFSMYHFYVPIKVKVSNF